MSCSCIAFKNRSTSFFNSHFPCLLYLQCTSFDFFFLLLPPSHFFRDFLTSLVHFQSFILYLVLWRPFLVHYSVFSYFVFKGSWFSILAARILPLYSVYQYIAQMSARRGVLRGFALPEYLEMLAMLRNNHVWDMTAGSLPK